MRAIPILLALCGAVISSCAEPAEQTIETETSHPTVRIGMLQHLSYAPLYIAKAEGFFEQEGASVEFVFISEVEGRVALEQGLIDAYALIPTPGFFNSVRSGGAARIVADRGHASGDCAAYAILVRPELMEDRTFEAADLAGRNVIYRDASAYAHILDTVFEDAGIARDEVQFMDNIGIAWMDAMSNGRVDVRATAEPQITVALDRGIARFWRSVHDVMPGYQFSVLFYGERLMNDRDLGNRLMVGYLRGVRQYLEGKTDRNVEIVSDFTNLSPELARKACWTAVKADASLNTESVDSFVAWAVRRGFLDAVVPVDDYYDSSFIEYANDELERRERPNPR